MSDNQISSLQRLRNEVNATYDVLYGVVHGLVERGTRLRDLAQSSDDLERASDILRDRSRRARFSRRQLSPAEFAFGLLCENLRVVFCGCFLCALVFWLLFRDASPVDTEQL